MFGSDGLGQSSILLMASFSFLLLLLWKYLKLLRLKRRMNLPGPWPPVPIFGQFLHMVYRRKDLHVWHQEMVQRYGKVFLMYWLGEAYVCVTDPDIVKAITVKNFANFTDRGAFGFNLPEPYDASLNQATGNDWKRIRNTINPAFSVTKIKQMVTFMDEAIDTLIEKIEKSTRSDQAVDMYRWFQGLTLEVVLTTSFGVKAETQTNPDDPLTNHARQAISRLFSALAIAMLPFGETILRKMNDPFHFEDLTNTARNIIEQRKRGKNIRHDLLHLMMCPRDKVTADFPLSNDEVLVQSIAFILAGYDTTSSALGFLFYELAFHADIQAKIAREVDELYEENEGTLPPYETILYQTPYIDAVIDEILRLHTPPFFYDRRCTESCTINGVHFPKDTHVLVPIYAMHMDPEVWPNPGKFDPRRFTREEKAKRHAYSYMPFGHGPRCCIGKRFALLQIKLVLIKILREYRVETTDETMFPVRKDLSILLNCPYDAVMLRFKNRRSTEGAVRQRANGSF